MTEDPVAAARRTIAALGPTGWGRRALADADIDALLAAAPPIEIAAGAVLAREGEPADRAFFLVAGRLRASVALGGGGPDRDRTVNEIAAGEVTGESALFLTGGRRVATLTALEPSAALVLRRELFLSGTPNPALVALESHILTGLARRIARTDAQILEAWRAASAGGGTSARAGVLDLLGRTS
jgi:CRP-like cAMP-binding protein